MSLSKKIHCLCNIKIFVTIRHSYFLKRYSHSYLEISQKKIQFKTRICHIFQKFTRMSNYKKYISIHKTEPKLSFANSNKTFRFLILK